MLVPAGGAADAVCVGVVQPAAACAGAARVELGGTGRGMGGGVAQAGGGLGDLEAAREVVWVGRECGRRWGEAGLGDDDGWVGQRPHPARW